MHLCGSGPRFGSEWTIINNLSLNTMEQQRYEPFDIDKGADKVFLIGSSFIVLFLFLL